jgi:acyl-CoA thioester hydrolase
MEKIEQAGVMLPVISVECHYKYPAKLGDTLRVVSIMDEIPRAKLVIKSEIYNESGKLLCNGEVGIGFIDATTRRPIRCPKDLAELFEKLINKK